MCLDLICTDMVLNKIDIMKAFSPKSSNKKPDVRSNLGRRHLHSNVAVGTTSDVKVYIRIRPFSQRESNAGLDKKSTIIPVDDKMLIFDPKEDQDQFFFHGESQKLRDISKKANKELECLYDKVFPPESTNLEVYESCTKSLITSLLEGYNCSVFVYGATGAGKTHTMLGSEGQPGITYLTMIELYNQLEQLSETKDFHIGVSYLEVYNENVHDLLQPSTVSLHLRENASGGVIVVGLKIHPIKDAAQLLELLEFGNKNRTQHPTDANAESSRSHAVFQVYVKITDKQGAGTKVMKLSMIDLAGSEKGMATGCSGSRFKEGSNINKSLLALGNCINNLADGLKHIPYRDSKLTRLLKDSLGGNCQTVMIANVSPSLLSYEDTYNTLKYASRAKKIKSMLSKNILSVKSHVGDYIKINEEQKKEILKLKMQIKALELAASKPVAKPTPTEPNRRYVEKMNTLFKEKIDLLGKFLTLESQEKTLEWRIRHKQLIASQLVSMVAADEDDTGGINRVNQTLRQLGARATSVHGKIKETRSLYRKQMLQINNFLKQMEELKISNLLQKDMQIKDYQALEMGLNIQISHHQKIIHMMDKRHDSECSLISNLTRLNTQFYLLLKGHNILTSSLENEYQATVRMLEGVKAVTWTDIDSELEDGEGTLYNSASVKPFMNLNLSLHRILNETVTEVETVAKVETELTPPIDGDAENDLNSTYVTSPTTVIASNIPVVPELPNTSSLTSSYPVPNFRPSSMPMFKVPKLLNSLPQQRNQLEKFSSRKENLNGNTKNNLATFSKNKNAKTLLKEMNSLTPKNAAPRVPLSTLKMSRINSRINRSHHPYMTPKSSRSHSARKNVQSATK